MDSSDAEKDEEFQEMVEAGWLDGHWIINEEHPKSRCKRRKAESFEDGDPPDSSE